MKKSALYWLKENFQDVEKVAGFDTGFMPEEEREAEVYQNFIEIYDSKKDFDEAMVDLPFLNKGESAFDFLSNINTAFEINGKYVFVDYMMVDDLYPGRKVG